MKRKKTIAVRLEGGIGDHILGMRLLYFIRRRFPHHKIIGYSDAGGGMAQVEAAKMSPFLSEAIPVYLKKKFPEISTWGNLENIDKKYLEMMRSADIFFDAWCRNFFIQESRILNVPFYEIMMRPPEIVVPKEAKIEASKFFKRYPGRIFVGLDISKHDLQTLRRNRKVIFNFIKGLLKNPKVVILNFYVSDYKFPHWPRALGMEREVQAARESLKTGELWNIDERVVPMVDFPVSMVAAFLERCRYFIGMDNGIKHLAWAMGIPHTFFDSSFPGDSFIFRWMPDFHRLLLFNCSRQDLLRHLSDAQECIKKAPPAR